MMTYYQGFGITSLDELTVSPTKFNEFLDDADSCVHPIGAVCTATVRLLRHAFWLAKQKATLTRKEYKELLKKLNWEGEEKRYLKVAAAFSSFTAQQLALIEPRTLFQIAENLKKYQSVITKIANLAQITQDAVRNFMKQCRKPKAKKVEEPPTIWRMAPDGQRVCQIGPIYNQSAGVMLQTMMDSEGVSAQTIIEEAIVARFESKYERTEEVLEVEAILEAPIENEQSAKEELLNDTESAPVTLNSEVVEKTEVSVVDMPSELVEDITEAPESSLWDSDVIEDSWSFDPEEKDDDIDDYELFATVQQELAPVDLLVQTFQNARSWQEINEVLSTHEEYKERAWSVLSQDERRRVIQMTPAEIIELRNAKKQGLIVNFRQIRTDVYEVQKSGSLFAKIVYKSELKDFLEQILV